jgi:hypothetical protein
MTDLEKRAEQGEAMLSYQEAWDNATTLRAKIERIRVNLGGICDWLKRLEESQTSSELVQVDFYSNTFASHINVLGNAAFREAMNYDTVVIDLHQQMAGALRRVEETTKKKEALGLR